jgi:hypothetical protein
VGCLAQGQFRLFVGSPLDRKEAIAPLLRNELRLIAKMPKRTSMTAVYDQSIAALAVDHIPVNKGVQRQAGRLPRPIARLAQA